MIASILWLKVTGFLAFTMSDLIAAPKFELEVAQTARNQYKIFIPPEQEE